MASHFGSFDGSQLGAFVRSPLKARNQGPFTGFVIVGDSGSVCTSSDGSTWTQRTDDGSGALWIGVAFSPTLGTGKGRFCAVAFGGNVMTSDDMGVTWTTRTAAEANEFTAIVWASALNLFVAISENGTHRVQTSPDGVTWTARTDALSGGAQLQWVALAVNPAGLLCATAVNGNFFKQTMYSTDGITWTISNAISETSENLWRCIAWSPDLNLFCASDGAAFSITSTDAISWTSGASSSVTSTAMAWSSLKSLFTTGGAWSTDGLVWTAATVAPTSALFGVLWSTNKSLFIGCANTNKVFTSTDGKSWTAHTTAVGTAFRAITEGVVS